MISRIAVSQLNRPPRAYNSANPAIEEAAASSLSVMTAIVHLCQFLSFYGWVGDSWCRLAPLSFRSESLRDIYLVAVYASDMDSLSEQAFLVLAALADQPRHGYALVTEVATMSDGRVQLRASTLYAVLERLTSRGLVMHDHDEVDNGRLRRFYRLTDAGAAAIRTETQRMTTQARAARRRLARRDAQATPRLGVAG